MATDTLADAELFDAEIRRSLDIFAVINGGLDPIFAKLNSTDDAVETIALKLIRKPNQTLPVAELRKLNIKAVGAAFKQMERFGLSVAKDEAEYLFELYSESESEGVKPLTAEQVKEVVERVKFLGQDVAGHHRHFGTFRRDLILDELRTMQGAAKGGAKLNPNFTLTSLERGREAMRSLVKTYIAAIREDLRKRFMRRNPALKMVEFWSAILDNRTTIICITNDGAIRKIGEREWSNGYTGKYPAHYGERSSILRMSLKAALAMQARRENAAQWFARQPEEVQRKILGATRYDLYKRGVLDLQSFVNSKGRKLKLSELGRRAPGIRRLINEAKEQALANEAKSA